MATVVDRVYGLTNTVQHLLKTDPESTDLIGLSARLQEILETADLPESSAWAIRMSLASIRSKRPL
jgi:hypothetical protein